MKEFMHNSRLSAYFKGTGVKRMLAEKMLSDCGFNSSASVLEFLNKANNYDGKKLFRQASIPFSNQYDLDFFHLDTYDDIYHLSYGMVFDLADNYVEGGMIHWNNPRIEMWQDNMKSIVLLLSAFIHNESGGNKMRIAVRLDQMKILVDLMFRKLVLLEDLK